MRIRQAVLAAMLAGATIAAPFPAAAAQPPVQVRIIAFNDFHGNLEPPDGSSGQIDGVDAGGVSYLASHVRALRDGVRHSIVVSAGDLIGASPLISGLFHDEPTVEAADVLGLTYNAVGNHELDDGADELLRIQHGGCHPVDGCATDEIYPGARFRILAANVIDTATDKPLFPGSAIHRFGAVRVGFIGVVTRSVPTLVAPESLAGLQILDEAAAVNREAAKLRKQGVEAIVVLVHEGGWQTGDIDECAGASGPILDIVERLDPGIDVVISGHTHQAYRCELDGRLVTSAKSFGRLLTRIDLTIDRKTGEVLAHDADNLIVTRDVTPAPDEEALIARWKTLADPVANEVIGTLTEPIVSTPSDSGQAPAGNVIADARLDGFADDGVVAAFVSLGSVREDIEGTSADGSGDLTYANLYAVEPWGNTMVTMDLTGAQLDALLELQFDNPSAGEQRWLQVSHGFSYTWSASAPAGQHVDAATIAIGGVPVEPDGTYRVAVDSFLAGGGDGFVTFTEGTGIEGGSPELDILEAWFRGQDAVSAPADDRVTAAP